MWYVLIHGLVSFPMLCLHMLFSGDIEDLIMAMVAADQQEQLRELAESMGSSAPVPAAAGAR